MFTRQGKKHALAIAEFWRPKRAREEQKEHSMPLLNFEQKAEISNIEHVDWEEDQALASHRDGIYRNRSKAEQTFVSSMQFWEAKKKRTMNFFSQYLWGQKKDRGTSNDPSSVLRRWLRYTDIDEKAGRWALATQRDNIYHNEPKAEQTSMSCDRLWTQRKRDTSTSAIRFLRPEERITWDGPTWILSTKSRYTEVWETAGCSKRDDYTYVCNGYEREQTSGSSCPFLRQRKRERHSVSASNF